MSGPLILSEWVPVGESSNSRYFTFEKRVLIGLPWPGTIDDEQSARENVRFQHDYFRKNGAGVIVVFFDNVTSQLPAARAVYQDETDPSLLVATALVGGNVLSRALGSFFIGLGKQRVPVKMFGTLDKAVAWSHERIALFDAQLTG